MCPEFNAVSASLCERSVALNKTSPSALPRLLTIISFM